MSDYEIYDVEDSMESLYPYVPAEVKKLARAAAERLAMSGSDVGVKEAYRAFSELNVYFDDFAPYSGVLKRMSMDVFVTAFFEAYDAARSSNHEHIEEDVRW